LGSDFRGLKARSSTDGLEANGDAAAPIAVAAISSHMQMAGIFGSFVISCHHSEYE
jgi:hypothetical protein